jgi:hypothetical protein
MLCWSAMLLRSARSKIKEEINGVAAFAAARLSP